jgi:lipopolysaccharide/colanic/teichoic acid biosynthesis glycosyltransferase
MLPLIDAHPTSDTATVAPTDDSTETIPSKARLYDTIKPFADFSIALILFALSLPVMIVAAILTRLTSRGPALYTQVRLGRDGRPFHIYKIRTMRHNCEALTGATWCRKGDSRITPIGKILRKTHMDELPQLWNVLRGDMSMVGPRPERPEIVETLEGALAGYRGRLTVKPGVTGLAQIQLPPDTDIGSVREKLILDLCYVRQYGASLDIRLLIGTGLYLAGASYTGVRQAMALPTGGPHPVPRTVPLKG